MDFWNIGYNTFNIFWEIERKPYCIYRKLQLNNNNNNLDTSPFRNSNNRNNELEYTDFIIPCVYNENDELIASENIITTQKQFFIFIRESDLLNFGIRQPSFTDKIIFPVDESGKELPYNQKPNTYSIKGFSYIFGLWRLKVDKDNL